MDGSQLCNVIFLKCVTLFFHIFGAFSTTHTPTFCAFSQRRSFFKTKPFAISSRLVRFAEASQSFIQLQSNCKSTSPSAIKTLLFPSFRSLCAVFRPINGQQFCLAQRGITNVFSLSLLAPKPFTALQHSPPFFILKYTWIAVQGSPRFLLYAARVLQRFCTKKSLNDSDGPQPLCSDDCASFLCGGWSARLYIYLSDLLECSFSNCGYGLSGQMHLFSMSDAHTIYQKKQRRCHFFSTLSTDLLSSKTFVLLQTRTVLCDVRASGAVLSEKLCIVRDQRSAFHYPTSTTILGLMRFPSNNFARFHSDSVQLFTNHHLLNTTHSHNAKGDFSTCHLCPHFNSPVPCSLQQIVNNFVTPNPVLSMTFHSFCSTAVFSF
ncbi:hypothetical protein T4A_1740 [Trichinella pseudospiralis]|uniref:Uncharacterized protein n=1 Tax=Trichinella pseudospiralis TaxID=6337 RepID=A0A0V1DXQ7_TRIPS|nr:hypothetical protein T4A_1740 [Trichinella pseudospiralis]